jgi:Family of unknown function (DUF5681)
MAAGEGGYRVGRGKPPLHTRFRKGRSGNPAGPRKKDLSALLLAALDEKVTVDRRRVTKREAIVAKLVDRSAGADSSATRLLLGMLREIEKKAAMAAPGTEGGTAPGTEGEKTAARPLTGADDQIVAGLVDRLRRLILCEIANGAEAG